MRVLLVHSDLLGGGIEKVLVTLARALPVRHKAICYCPANHPEPPQDFIVDLRSAGVELFRVEPPVVSWRYPMRLARVIGRYRPDVVHCHGAWLGIVGGLLRLRFPRRPLFVYTQHPNHSQEAAWLRRLSRIAYARLHHIVCVAEAVRQDLLALPGRQRLAARTSVIFNGIDLDPFLRSLPDHSRHQLRSKLGAGESDLLIGSVGLLWPIKGYQVLIPAFARVARQLASVRLAIIGRGKQEQELRVAARQEGVADRVSFAGWRSDVPELMQCFDLYVQPSLSEGLPVAPIEASASALPIVATRVGGMPEVVVDGQTGLLVPPGDPGALADAMLRLLQNRALAARLAAAARDRAVREFSAETMAEKYMTLYTKLLGDGGDSQRGREGS